MVSSHGSRESMLSVIPLIHTQVSLLCCVVLCCVWQSCRLTQEYSWCSAEMSTTHLLNYNLLHSRFETLLKEYTTSVIVYICLSCDSVQREDGREWNNGAYWAEMSLYSVLDMIHVCIIKVGEQISLTCSFNLNQWEPPKTPYQPPHNISLATTSITLAWRKNWHVHHIC